MRACGRITFMAAMLVASAGSVVYAQNATDGAPASPGHAAHAQASESRLSQRLHAPASEQISRPQSPAVVPSPAPASLAAIPDEEC